MFNSSLLLCSGGNKTRWEGEVNFRRYPREVYDNMGQLSKTYPGYTISSDRSDPTNVTHSGIFIKNFEVCRLYMNQLDNIQLTFWDGNRVVYPGFNTVYMMRTDTNAKRTISFDNGVTFEGSFGNFITTSEIPDWGGLEEDSDDCIL